MRMGISNCGSITRKPAFGHHIRSLQSYQHAGRIVCRSWSLTSRYTERRLSNKSFHRQISTDASTGSLKVHPAPPDLVRKLRKVIHGNDPDPDPSSKSDTTSLEKDENQTLARETSTKPVSPAWKSSIEGKTLHFPNLNEIFKDWPRAESSHKKIVQERLSNLVRRRLRLPAPKQQFLFRSSIPSFVTKCYPGISLDRTIDIVCRYTIWSFLWSHHVGRTALSSSEDFADFSQYLRDCMDCVQLSMRITPDDLVERSHGLTKETLLPENMRGFGKLGITLGDIGAPTLSRFSKAVCSYIRSFENRLEMMALPHVPTVSTYMKAALPSVEISPPLELYEYILFKELNYPSAPKTKLAKYLKYSNALTKNVAEIALIIRDICAVRTDVMAGSQFNLVVSSFFDGGVAHPRSAEEVVDSLMELLRAKKIEFDATVIKLDEVTKIVDSKIIARIITKKAMSNESHMKNYIQWCQWTLTGYLDWSLTSRRYHLKDSLQKDGSLRITLE
ncbi:hypothetical protein AA313_de0207660 [Arthrobotrys entomopaga]|nr:hypothetical protein AA313_de0207660 [Arthrobotrys entomopaga]